jgi:methyl-accepting chemotaxis protein
MQKISTKLLVLVSMAVLCLTILAGIIITRAFRDYSGLASFQKTTEISAQVYDLLMAITQERSDSWGAAVLKGDGTMESQVERYRKSGEISRNIHARLLSTLTEHRDSFSDRFVKTMTDALNQETQLNDIRNGLLDPGRKLVPVTDETAVMAQVYNSYDAFRNALEYSLPTLALETEDAELVRRIVIQDLTSRMKTDLWRLRSLVSTALRSNSLSDKSLSALEVKRQSVEQNRARIVQLVSGESSQALSQMQTDPAFQTILRLSDEIVKAGYGKKDYKWLYDFNTYQNGEFVQITKVFDGFASTVTRDINTYTAQRIAAARLTLWLVCAAVGIMVLGLLVAITLVTRSITRPLRRLSNDLAANSDVTIQAAGEIGESSIKLSDDSMEEAAAIEEISASAEELAGMTTANLQGVREVAGLARKASESAGHGSKVMSDLCASLDTMMAHNKDVSKVLKTIEEIAFQTNILALNAAVEAARAGEAGTGFAVVADEVRTLARRCTEAANETAGKIGAALSCNTQSDQLGRAAEASFKEIAHFTQNYSTKVSEIELAAEQSSRGINQINAAISRLDTIAQRMAATSENNAAAAQEMIAQAKTLVDHIAMLEHMVGSQQLSQALDRKLTTVINHSDSHQASDDAPTATNGDGAPTDATMIEPSRTV